MNSVGEFVRYLQAKPRDFGMREVFAYWLAANGRPAAAAGQRLVCRSKILPPTPADIITANEFTRFNWIATLEATGWATNGKVAIFVPREDRDRVMKEILDGLTPDERAQSHNGKAAPISAIIDQAKEHCTTPALVAEVEWGGLRIDSNERPIRHVHVRHKGSKAKLEFELGYLLACLGSGAEDWKLSKGGLLTGFDETGNVVALLMAFGVEPARPAPARKAKPAKKRKEEPVAA